MEVIGSKRKYTSHVEGTGIEAKHKNLLSEITFPAIPVYTSTDTLVPLIINPAAIPLIIEDIKTGASDNGFSIKPISTNKVLPGDTVWVNVTFAPEMRGLQNDVILLKPEKTDWIKVCNLMGEGIASRKVHLTGTTIDAISNQPLSSTVKLTSLINGKFTNTLPTNN